MGYRGAVQKGNILLEQHNVTNGPIELENAYSYSRTSVRTHTHSHERKVLDNSSNSTHTRKRVHVSLTALIKSTQLQVCHRHICTHRSVKKYTLFLLKREGTCSKLVMYWQNYFYKYICTLSYSL